MPSTLTWLDTSDHDRRRALDVIDLFAVRDTVDELGLAGIRDAWADRLVPGTSTIQTRARYFLFVPWIYQYVRRDNYQPAGAPLRARKRELELIEAIASTDTEGVPIGARAGKGLKRLPSAIYWAGLGRLGIRLWQGSQAAFHRALPDLGPEVWHPHLPPYPDGFLEGSVLALENAEAHFLREQVRVHAPGSLLQFLMDSDADPEGADFPWEHPLRAQMGGDLSNWIDHIEAFAVLMHGAALLYNRMLAERLGDWSAHDAGERVEHFGKELTEWSDDVEAWRSSAGEWDRLEFWRMTREVNRNLPASAQNFSEVWIERVLASRRPLDLLDDDTARDLVEQREVRLKRNRSRLRHREQLERWGGSSGAARMNYRWNVTQRLVRDVQEGLARA